MKKLPDDFLELSKPKRRMIETERDAERFENGDPDAWLDLVLRAVDGDAHIPEETKTKLRALLFQLHKGEEPSGLLPAKDRAKNHDDLNIYLAMWKPGESVTEAKKRVAKELGLSERTVYRRYQDFLKKNPWRPRLDGRKSR